MDSGACFEDRLFEPAFLVETMLFLTQNRQKRAKKRKKSRRRDSNPGHWVTSPNPRPLSHGADSLRSRTTREVVEMLENERK